MWIYLKKEIIFVKSPQSIVYDRKSRVPMLHERDPVKISYENGETKLLVDVENSIISKLFRYSNFIPNVFVSQSAYELLVREGITEDISPSEQPLPH